MKKKCCLITGGAGFIGSALASKLVAEDKFVVAIDNMHPQIHKNKNRPNSLQSGVELLVADICDPGTWTDFLACYEPETVIHLAAETGTGQSLTCSSRHAHVNVVGLTTMLDAFSNLSIRPSHVLLASSRAVYGEGAWLSQTDRSVFYPRHRTVNMLEQSIWDFPDATALAMNARTTTPNPTNVYAATKLAQEQILEVWTNAFKVPLSILRLQNVYGIGQSLINDYTGIIPLFVRIAESGESIPVYEDGQITRDFVNIVDVISAFLLCIENPPTVTRTIDVGSGVRTTILELASLITKCGGRSAPRITGQYRIGDVRHAYCHIEDTKKEVGYSPSTTLKNSISELYAWIKFKMNERQ